MEDKRELIGGKLVLFRRNGLWQARVPLTDGRYLWRSLKTTDEAKATQDATRLYYQTETKLAEGLPVQTRTVDKVIDEYVAMREQDNRLGNAAKRGSSIKHTQDAMLRQIKRVVKFWREYAGKKPIEALDDKLLGGYVAWRKSYYHDMAELPKNAKLDPTDKTQRSTIIGWGLGMMLDADALTVRVVEQVPEQVLEYKDSGKETVIPQALRKPGSDGLTWWTAQRAAGHVRIGDSNATQAANTVDCGATVVIRV